MAVSIEISEESGVRYLHFGSRWVQGAMRIARPWALELDYTRDMMFPLLLHAAPSWPRTVLMIGLGTASILKFLHRHRPASNLTVVELEASVIAAARQYFKLPEESRRLAIAVAEGSSFLAGSVRTYDLILVDGFDAKGPAGSLQTLAFYRLCRSRLRERGILCVNLLGRNRGFQSNVERISAAFAGRMLLLPPSESGNAVLLAACGAAVATSASELEIRARKLRAKTGLDLAPTLARLTRSQADRESRLEL